MCDLHEMPGLRKCLRSVHTRFRPTPTLRQLSQSFRNDSPSVHIMRTFSCPALFRLFPVPRGGKGFFAPRLFTFGEIPVIPFRRIAI